MREGGREAAEGGVRKSGLFNDGGVYAKPLLQYGKLNGPLIWPSSFVTLFGEKGPGTWSAQWIFILPRLLA